MLQSVEVKQLTTNEQFEQVLALEQEIWQQRFTPMHTAFADKSSSSLMIGAYYEDELIGFNYSTYDEGELHSYLLGIKRTYREAGVGELIKLKQRELAEELELKKCTWLFEPLDARSAHLNFTKLRAFSVAYFVDKEAEIGAPAVVPVDRLAVELDITDRDHFRWDAKLDEVVTEAKEVAGWSLNLVGLPALGDFDAALTYLDDAYTLPIPTYISKLIIESPALAEDWRYKTRAVFTTLFAQGYAIVKLVPTNEHVSHYLFVKRSLFGI